MPSIPSFVPRITRTALTLAFGFVLGLSATVFAEVDPAETPSPAGTGTADCYETAETQSDLTRCAGDKWAAAEEEMTAVYDTIRERFEDDSLFIDRFEAAQQAWRAYREAHAEARFPQEPDQPNRWGSIFPMCWRGEMDAMARQRTAELRRWIQGTVEGDACAGSYPRTSVYEPEGR